MKVKNGKCYQHFPSVSETCPCFLFCEINNKPMALLSNLNITNL